MENTGGRVTARTIPPRTTATLHRRRGAVAAAGEAKSEAASHAANFRLVILSLISTHILCLGRFKSEIRLCNA